MLRICLFAVEKNRDPALAPVQRHLRTQVLRYVVKLSKPEELINPMNAARLYSSIIPLSYLLCCPFNGEFFILPSHNVLIVGETRGYNWFFLMLVAIHGTGYANNSRHYFGMFTVIAKIYFQFLILVPDAVSTSIYLNEWGWNHQQKW